MFVHNIDPVLLSIGPLSIRWYGVLYAAGWFVVYLLGGYALRKRKLMNEDEFQNFFLGALITVVVGARLGSVLSDFPYYAAHPAEIIAIWNGGVSFHGGLVGAILFSLWYLRKNKKRILGTADMMAMSVALSLAIGRIGNFINSEFVGIKTSLPWGVVFPDVAGARHPVQIYESLLMLSLFLILLWMFRKRAKDGMMFGFFMVYYAIGRFLLEYLKDPLGVTHIGPFTWGQFWNIPMLIAGIWLIHQAASGKRES